MKTWRFTGLLAIALLIVSPAARADVTEEDTFERTVALGGGGQVEVETTNGSIRVETWDRSEVQVVARKKARDHDAAAARDLLERIEVQVQELGDKVRVTARLPRSGWFGGSSASVSFVLTVPSDAELTATSSNGSIKVRDLGGRARLETDNGSIEADGVRGALRAHSDNGRIEALDVHGAIEAKTTNGAVKAEIATADLAEDVSLETTNGSVELRLDPGVAASLYARTDNGSVSSDFPGGIQDRRKKTLELDLNGGGPRIRLESTNGSIRVRER